jgi:hypothetical protein
LKRVLSLFLCVLFIAGCSPVDKNLVDSIVAQTLDSPPSTLTPYPTHTPYPTQTPYPTKAAEATQTQLSSENPTSIVTNPTLLPKVGTRVICDGIQLRVLEVQKSPYVSQFNPPAGIYLLVYTEITNTGSQTLIGIDPALFLINGIIAGNAYQFTMYKDYAIWRDYFWNVTLLGGGNIGLFEPFYPNIPSRVILIFDINRDSTNNQLFIKGCPASIDVNQNSRVVSKLTGGQQLQAPPPIAKGLVADYEEAYWKDILENPAPLEGKKVILRGVVRRVSTVSKFSLTIAGTSKNYTITMKNPLDRIYQMEAITVYGTMTDGKLSGDYIEVTNIPR